eukprot:3976801-Ditylum_brightwellii.AAC.1
MCIRDSVDPPSTSTGGVSWADVAHCYNDPNAMPSTSTTPTPAKAVSRAIADADSNLKKWLDEFYEKEDQHKVQH